MSSQENLLDSQAALLAFVTANRPESPLIELPVVSGRTALTHRRLYHLWFPAKSVSPRGTASQPFRCQGVIPALKITIDNLSLLLRRWRRGGRWRPSAPCRWRRGGRWQPSAPCRWGRGWWRRCRSRRWSRLCRRLRRAWSSRGGRRCGLRPRCLRLRDGLLDPVVQVGDLLAGAGQLLLRQLPVQVQVVDLLSHGLNLLLALFLELHILSFRLGLLGRARDSILDLV